MRIFFVLVAAANVSAAWAFVPSSLQRVSITVQKAGGFEWQDPTEAFDQGVENPFKNPDLMNSDDGMKIDPARLLGPRLNGANLYFVGMMGSGKTAVGDIVARSKFGVFGWNILFWFWSTLFFPCVAMQRNGHVQFPRHGSNN
jgi:hypothetical protein